MTAPSLTAYVAGQGAVTADNLNSFEQTCDTIPQLRAFLGVPGVQVAVRGLAAPFDGGGGTFAWVSGSGYVDNNSTVIVPLGYVVGAWLLISFWYNGVRNPIVQPYRKVAAGTTDTSTLSDGVIVWTSAAAANKAENIPSAATVTAGTQLTIKDGVGTAFPYPIVITPAAGLIDQAATFRIATPFQAVTLISDGVSLWSVI